MIHRRTILGAWAAGLLLPGVRPGSARAQDVLDPVPAPDAPGQVANVISGDEMQLDGGRVIRLAGIQAPRAAQGTQAAQPLFDDSREFLERLAANADISLHHVHTDRYGRVHAHVFIGEVWLQGEMLKAGMARVRTWPNERDRAAAMLHEETRARNTGMGIWREPFYTVRSPEALAATMGSFQLVEGQVVDAVQVRTMTYLNFGADWRTDFTIVANAKTARACKAAGLDLAGLSGAQIRVRGLVQSYNGPEIWLTHKEQLEVLT